MVEGHGVLPIGEKKGGCVVCLPSALRWHVPIAAGELVRTGKRPEGFDMCSRWAFRWKNAAEGRKNRPTNEWRKALFARSITHLNGRPEPVGCMFSVCLFYRCEDQENPRYPRFSAGSRAETSCKLWSAAYGHLWRERSVLPMFSSSHAKIF